MKQGQELGLYVKRVLAPATCTRTTMSESRRLVLDLQQHERLGDFDIVPRERPTGHRLQHEQVAAVLSRINMQAPDLV